MSVLKTTLRIFCLCAGLYGGVVSASASYLDHPKGKAFIDDMVKRHQFDRQTLNQLFAKVKPLQSVLDAMSRPAEKRLTWGGYRPIFVKPKRVEGGVAFWRKHQQLLAKVSREYGVPEEIIVAIVGVETYYGRYKGKHKVLDSVATLAFDYPRRSAFFTKELEALLLLSREEKLDPTVLKGSYAGAMGMPQFIASSYRAYSVDYNQDGKRDLLTDVEDILGSVANYFKRHGWQPGEPVTERLHQPSAKAKQLASRRAKRALTLQDLKAAGVTLKHPGKGKYDIIKLETKSGDQYWVTRQNFYTITRYNTSALYAMAVFQLAEQIRTQYQQQT